MNTRTAAIAAGAALGATLCSTVRASAHEPVFGLGPHTLYEGGFSTSLSYEHDVAASEGEDANRASIGLTYGVTANLNLAVGVPYVLHQPSGDGHVDGFGDPVVQVKWRPWASFSKRNVDALSLLGAVKVPAGEDDISPGNTAYVFGATLARENIRYYGFTSVRYIAQTAGLRGKPGNVFLYDAAVGVRPVVLEYDQPDAVVLVEFNGRTVEGFTPHDEPETTTQALEPSDEYRTVRQAHSGGTTTATGVTGAGGTELAVVFSPKVFLAALQNRRNPAFSIDAQVLRANSLRRAVHEHVNCGERSSSTPTTFTPFFRALDPSSSSQGALLSLEFFVVDLPFGETLFEDLHRGVVGVEALRRLCLRVPHSGGERDQQRDQNDRQYYPDPHHDSSPVCSGRRAS